MIYQTVEANKIQRRSVTCHNDSSDISGIDCNHSRAAKHQKRASTASHYCPLLQGSPAKGSLKTCKYQVVHVHLTLTTAVQISRNKRTNFKKRSGFMFLETPKTSPTFHKKTWIIFKDFEKDRQARLSVLWKKKSSTNCCLGPILGRVWQKEW